MLVKFHLNLFSSFCVKVEQTSIFTNFHIYNISTKVGITRIVSYFFHQRVLHGDGVYTNRKPGSFKHLK